MISSDWYLDRLSSSDDWWDHCGCESIYYLGNYMCLTSHRRATTVFPRNSRQNRLNIHPLGDYETTYSVLVLSFEELTSVLRTQKDPWSLSLPPIDFQGSEGGSRLISLEFELSHRNNLFQLLRRGAIASFNTENSTIHLWNGIWWVIDSLPDTKYSSVSYL